MVSEEKHRNGVGMTGKAREGLSVMPTSGPNCWQKQDPRAELYIGFTTPPILALKGMKKQIFKRTWAAAHPLSRRAMS